MKDKKVLFVHIPKTAGTSVRVFLERNKLDSWSRNRSMKHHDTYVQLKLLNSVTDTSNFFIFTICRNPYTRAFSYYNHFKRVNGITNVSFYDFLNLIQEKIYFPQTPMIQYDQSYYIEDEEGHIAKIKIYRFENLDLFENDFMVKLPRLNSGNFNIEEYMSAYKQERTIDLIQAIYKRDFVNFNYSMEFKNSMVDFD